MIFVFFALLRGSFRSITLSSCLVVSPLFQSMGAGVGGGGVGASGVGTGVGTGVGIGVGEAVIVTRAATISSKRDMYDLSSNPP